MPRNLPILTDQIVELVDYPDSSVPMATVFACDLQGDNLPADNLRTQTRMIAKFSGSAKLNGALTVLQFSAML